MTAPRMQGLDRAIPRRREAGFGLVFALAAALAHPARAAAGGSAGGMDTLPPPGTHIAAFVADSTTGLPLIGASVSVQNSAGNLSRASTDSGGRVFLPRSGLPYLSPASTLTSLWVTAGHPGYLSRLVTLSGCGSDVPEPCVLRYALSRATEGNSFAFTGTLLDSARTPIAGLPLDLSSGMAGGYITFLSATDARGGFVFRDLPKGLREGYLFVRSSPRRFQMLTVYWSNDGDSLVVPGWSPTSVTAPRARPRASAEGKPAAVLLFRSTQRDAAGRRRD